ncbi:polyamine aminopropyltransferase [Thermoflexus sp.]|uniref:polyamine aminopropyltransferase n=1 Tax=Thermoflexus sp. TaxID=1969742 RepID=UPI002ADD3903|nr:polyamine aminopropyltransferase [Thermoflexus sp.]
MAQGALAEDPFEGMRLTFAEESTITAVYQVRRVLAHERSALQEIAILELENWGKALVLDGVIQFTQRDEFFYHESLVHPAMMAHPNPRRVLVIGGGDGGVAREALRHPTVEEVIVVEVDGQVVELCRRHMPEFASSFDDPRVRLIIGNGRTFLEEHPDAYDVILLDSNDPLAELARSLFDPAFFRLCAEHLTDEGMLALHLSESLFREGYLGYEAPMVRKALGQLFRYVETIPMPYSTYPCNWWSFIVCSKGLDPRVVRNPHPFRGRYYDPDYHRWLFAPPAFMDRLEELKGTF